MKAELQAKYEELKGLYTYVTNLRTFVQKLKYDLEVEKQKNAEVAAYNGNLQQQLAVTTQQLQEAQAVNEKQQ